MTTPADRARAAFLALRNEIEALALSDPTIDSAAFASWEARAQSVLSRTLGAKHPITQQVASARWVPSSVIGRQAAPDAFISAAQQVRGYLEAAVAELDWLNDEAGTFDAAGVDSELWAFVAADIEGAHWGKAATQTTLFIEDRIRKWTGQRDGLVGVDLMSAVFGEKGNYRLGRTDAESQGWHRFAMGITMALRNVVAHRIEDRPDHRRYALGVLGSCSLLLTQLRYEHGNRFSDPSPVAHGDNGELS